MDGASLTCARRAGVQNLAAAHGRVVRALALLAVVVPDVVSVVLEELLGRHLLGELPLPEDEGVLQSQPHALEKQAVLHAPAVAQVVLRLEPRVQVLHAQWEGGRCQGVHVVRRHVLHGLRQQVERCKGRIVAGKRSISEWLHMKEFMSNSDLAPVCSSFPYVPLLLTLTPSCPYAGPA